MGKEGTKLTGEATSLVLFSHEQVDVPVNRDSKMSSYRAFKKPADRKTGSMKGIAFDHVSRRKKCR